MTAVAPISRPSGIIRIRNNFHKEHRERFKGQEVVIPAGGSIEMEYYDAIGFLGQFYPSVKNDAGEYLRCKALTKEVIEQDQTVGPIFISHADGKAFTTEKELEDHLKNVATGSEFKAVKDEKLDAKLAAESKKNDEALDKVASVLGTLVDKLDTVTGRLDALESKGKKKRDTVRHHNSSETSE